ncbi:MAG: hypothetical protein QXR44_01635 [Thermoproteota archaeon]
MERLRVIQVSENELCIVNVGSEESEVIDVICVESFGKDLMRGYLALPIIIPLFENVSLTTERFLKAPIPEDWVVGVITRSGNVFWEEVPIRGKRLCKIQFQVLDTNGNPFPSAKIVFGGVEYAHGSLVNVTEGFYSLSTGTMPFGWGLKWWECSGGVVIVNFDSPTTSAIISGDGTITMRVTMVAIVEFSATGIYWPELWWKPTVLVVDGKNYTSDVTRYGPIKFVWEVNSPHNFEWIDPIQISSVKRYAWNSTSGLTTNRNGTIIVPPGGGSIQAVYKLQWYLTMSVVGSGWVSPGSGWYEANAVIQIAATPDTYWRFERWRGSGTGSYTGTSNPATITMRGAITETAYFYTFTLSVSPSSRTVRRGYSTSATVTVSLSGGYSTSVSVYLSVIDYELPPGVTVSFSRNPVTVSTSSRTATSTMTIRTSSNTPPGTYDILVIGSGAEITRTTVFTLVVTE